MASCMGNSVCIPVKVGIACDLPYGAGVLLVEKSSVPLLLPQIQMVDSSIINGTQMRSELTLAIKNSSLSSGIYI